ncbi:MAG: agmatine deiminase family protein [Dysgonamonadaceae bacterium]|jgi:agmatine/peptidylarginine deiminase|nr:agmatine deiminase family protein [Dysgonamonadaceae bacterium]
MARVVFPAEWHSQSGVQIAFPHSETDWFPILDEVKACYLAFSKEILKREKLLIVSPESEGLEQFFTAEERRNLIVAKAKTNDTWARDHGGLPVFIDGLPTVLDFGFNAWGLKFAANHDNLITQELFRLGVFRPEVQYRNHLNFVLEGGSVESDGKGTLLTTSRCLLAPNRNQPMQRREIERFLLKTFGLKRILWLNHGYLAGDDTDNHVDTLARFCDERTIAYVQCTDKNDTHFAELQAMEKELQAFLTEEGKPYKLIALPMADEVVFEGSRLPATYANFLIVNGAVLLPFYASAKDEMARGQLQKAFLDREIIGIDCRPLIKQHGSLHCVTMQLPDGFL